MQSISQTVARRYVLGRQGLWPGRRWAGKAGTAEAIRQSEAVQIDPLNVVGRNHDLVLHSRVAGYQPALLEELAYTDRAFFDFGATLFIYPMTELPYWRVVMQRYAAEPSHQQYVEANASVIDEVRDELSQRGPLGHRDFVGRARINSYRARKDAGLALFHLWLTGELMTHSRRGQFERLYGLREQVAPHDDVADAADAELFFARKTAAHLGLAPAGLWSRQFAGTIRRKLSPVEGRRWLEQLTGSGDLAAVTVEGRKGPYYLPAADLPLLDTLAAGQVPDAWQPQGPTTAEEVTFLAPLDIVSARGRAREVFGFDYVWEVYKPAPVRRWGYYTLPILYGDQLVARLDPKLDRKTGTLAVMGFWLEDAVLGADPGFAAALGQGLARLASFLGARRVDLDAIHPDRLRRRVKAALS